MNTINRVMLADSYKYSHPAQYPANTTKMWDYLEARSSKVYDHTVVFGLQYIIEKYLSKPIEQWEVDEAYDFAVKHGVDFDKDGWDYIVRELEGKFPVEIRAVREGSVIPNGNVLITIESTDPKVFWIVGFLETLLLKVWYPMTVATKSYEVKKMIDRFLKKSGSFAGSDFSYHNFGDRGSSSVESAAIGGMAHLTSFLGTDNFNALRAAKRYYQEDIAGFSINASEHSTVTSWGKEGRFDMYNAFIEKNKGKALVACVMDSYDIYEDVRYICSGERKKKIESDAYPDFVIRPDSGDPIEVLDRLLSIVEEESVGFTVNKKGFKVLSHYRFIWGDGVSPQNIEKILEFFIQRGYSAENISFGSGGDLMQNINRDTLGFAIKCSAIEVDGEIREVFKNPVTDSKKQSKKGVLDLFLVDGVYITGKKGDYPEELSVLETVFKNGEVFGRCSLGEVRERISS